MINCVEHLIQNTYSPSADILNSIFKNAGESILEQIGTAKLGLGKPIVKEEGEFKFYYGSQVFNKLSKIATHYALLNDLKFTKEQVSAYLAANKTTHYEGYEIIATTPKTLEEGLLQSIINGVNVLDKETTKGTYENYLILLYLKHYHADLFNSLPTFEKVLK